MRYKLTYLLMILLLSAPLIGQSVKSLPDDPRIVKGQVPNGFTYYLVQNDIKSGYADFYLLRKVGSINESKEQAGFNSLLSDMGVRGTRNFPDNTILSYFDELGIDQHLNFQMFDGVENSYHKITDVPVKKGGGVIDSTLLILYNWASSINIDEEDLEKEKLYYKNYITREYNGEIRAGLNHTKHILHPDSQEGVDIEKIISGIDNYTSKEIRSFYYKWFSPDRMALVVVGDIDGASLSSKINSLYQALPKYIGKVEDVEVSFAEQQEPVVSIVCEPEVSGGRLDISFTTPSLPENLRLTAVPFVEEYMISVMKQLITERLSLTSADSKAPFFLEGVEYGHFLGNSAKSALTVSVKVPKGDVEDVVKVIMRELYAIKRDGFAKKEYDRGQKTYFQELNYVYDWRVFTPNEYYATRAINNFFYGFSLASVEMKKEYMDLVKYEVGVQQFNTFVSSFLRDGDNCVITYTTPAPVQDNLKERILQVAEREITHYKEADSLCQLQYKDYQNTFKGEAGTVISESHEMITDSKVWKLSNGATVVYKRSQAEPNKFTFEAVAKGGTTLMDANNYSRPYINEIIDILPIGDIPAPQMAVYKKNQKVLLQKRINFATSTLSGQGYTQNIETFVKMVNSHFVPSVPDTKGFEKYQKIKREELEYRSSDPDKVFGDSIISLRYHKSSYINTVRASDLDKIQYKQTLKFINSIFSNAADYHFIFVGDLDEVLLKDLVCRYIATLPGNVSGKSNWRNIPVYLKKYNQTKIQEVEDMDSPRSIYNMTISGASSYTLKGVVDMSLSSEILRKRVSRKMNEKGFPIEIETKWVKYPEEFVTLSISSVTKEYDKEFVKELTSIIDTLKIQGATPIEIRNAKNSLKESYYQGERGSNLFWKDILVNRFIYGKDFYSRYTYFIDNASESDINRTLREYLMNSTTTTLIFKGTNDTNSNSN